MQVAQQPQKHSWNYWVAGKMEQSLAIRQPEGLCWSGGGLILTWWGSGNMALFASLSGADELCMKVQEARICLSARLLLGSGPCCQSATQVVQPRFQCKRDFFFYFYLLSGFLPSSRQEDRYHSFNCACINKEETGRARPLLISLAQTLVINGKC